MKNREGWKHERPNGTEPPGVLSSHALLLYVHKDEMERARKQETRRLQNANNVETQRDV